MEPAEGRAPRRATVKERRLLIAAERWVCERCGELNEEALAVWRVDRQTRGFPAGRCVILCDQCEDKTPHDGCEDQ